MPSLAETANRIRSLDDFSRLRSPIHTFHPVAILATAVVYATVVMSFNRYAVSPLLPLALYPVLLVAVSGIPVAAVLGPVLAVEPLILAIGLLNPLLDSQPVDVAGLTLARGWLVLLSLAIKCGLAVASAALLAAVLGIDGIAAAMRRLGAPKSFVMQLALTFRYIWLLLGEAGRLSTAYALRSGRRRGIRFRDWGALAGNLLARSYERAARVHQAMLLRGFDGDYAGAGGQRIRCRDVAFVAGWLAFFALVRFHDVSETLGRLLTGAIAR